MATVSILTSPQGSQFTQTIGAEDDADLNDFDVFFHWDENVTGFEQSDVGLTAGYTIQSFEGSGCCYRAVIRPPTTAGVLTVSLAADVVTEDNPATSQDIRVSTSFPDVDAETPTELFAVNGFQGVGIAVSPTRIVITEDNARFFTFDGTEQTGERFATAPDYGRVDYFNDTLLSQRADSERRMAFDSDTELESYAFVGGSPIIHTRLGVLKSGWDTSPFRYLPYGKTASADIVDLNMLAEIASDNHRIAHQNDLLMMVQRDLSGYFLLAELTGTPDVAFHRRLNIRQGSAHFDQIDDIALYQDTLYILENTGNSNWVYTIDARKYRPLSLNTKANIPIVFSTNGQTINLTQYAPDASDIIFDTGFDKPDYLSINANNQLSITSNAVSTTTPVLVKARGINSIDSHPFSFYLIIEPNTAPVPREVDNLSMRADTTFDLHQIVEADSITFESGQTQPTGSSISDGIFTIGTVGGDAYFTATRDGLSANFQFNVDIVQAPDPANFSEQFRHRVEIRDIDVTADVPNFPEISKTLDAVALNEYRNDSVTIILSDDGGKYNPDIEDNFWDTNTLNYGGFREPIKVFVENLIGGSYVSSLLFSGVIYQEAESISEIEARLQCREIAYVLRQANVSDFGVNEKWDALRQQSDEDSFEGIYIPEGSLTPMQIGTGKAWRDRTELDISRIALQSEGQSQANTAYMTTSDLRTAGGYLSDNPVMNFKTRHLSEDVRFLWNQLALNKNIYNTFIDLPDVELNDPFILNRGSVPFSVERTRNTRLIADWVHDATNERVLMVLGNPEGHIADVLVSYRIESDSYRTLYTFDKDVKAWRIERRDATNYYVLTSAPITQDRSAQALPRASDKTGYAYDARAAGSVIRIHHYDASTSTLTEFVAEDDTHPAQLGIHVHAGFENTLYIDEFEGIVPYNRGAFRWYSNNLYYRYCTGSAFGVARADASGTTTALISETDLNYHNWLNFAFDVDTSNGDTFFVYATGDADESTLTIKKRTSAGVVSTVLTDTQTLQAFSALDGGGAYLGCHEALFHNDTLYMLCPIQRVDEDSGTYTRSREKSAGAVLYSCDVNAGTPTLTAIEPWDFIQRAGCNLTKHDSNVHYTENPIASAVFRAINEDL